MIRCRFSSGVLTTLPDGKLGPLELALPLRDVAEATRTTRDACPSSDSNSQTSQLRPLSRPHSWRYRSLVPPARSRGATPSPPNSATAVPERERPAEQAEPRLPAPAVLSALAADLTAALPEVADQGSGDVEGSEEQQAAPQHWAPGRRPVRRTSRAVAVRGPTPAPPAGTPRR